MKRITYERMPEETPMHAEMTHDAALAAIASGWWHKCRPEEIVRYQLFQRRLCMDWADFHDAVEEALGRPVHTVEFRSADILRRQFLAAAAA